jgi:uncharacterized membrane protein
MRSIAYALLVGLVGAIVAHIAVVFLVPHITGGRAHQTLQSLFTTDKPIVLSAGEAAAAGLVGADPAMRMRICLFDFSDGGLLVQSEDTTPFFTLSILNDRDQIAFSAVDRLMDRGLINLEILPATERLRRAQSDPQADNAAVPIFVEAERGYVVIRAFSGDDSTDSGVDTFLSKISCDVEAF